MLSSNILVSYYGLLHHGLLWVLLHLHISSDQDWCWDTWTRQHVPSSHSPILLARSRYEKQWQGALSTMLTLRNPTPLHTLMHTQYLVAYPIPQCIPSMPRHTEAHWAPCCKARWLTASIICIREIILAPLSRSRRRIQVSIGKLHHTWAAQTTFGPEAKFLFESTLVIFTCFRHHPFLSFFPFV